MSITIPPKDCQVLFLDMNSFFASVEQQVRPELRGQPVGVTPYVGDSGCVIAASYEAKKRGVRIGRVGEARKICPEITILPSRPALYMIYHEEIKKVLLSLTPHFQAMSIDEFLIRLTPKEQNESAAVDLANQIKDRINKQVGDYLKCSVGISASYFLAKVAGESRKPNGLTILKLANLPDFYKSRELLDLPGINWRLEKTLNSFKIYTPLSLYQKTLPEMTAKFGHWGRVWYFRLRGFGVDDFVVKTKTIGHSHVLAPEFRTRRGAVSVINKLIQKTGYRLRKDGYWANGVSVSIRFLNHTGFHHGQKTAVFCDDQTLRQNIHQILKDCPWSNVPIYVALSTFNLQRLPGAQLSILPEVEKNRRISSALDEINDEFGAGTVYSASMFKGRESAPDRIPFGRPRYDIRHK